MFTIFPNMRWSGIGCRTRNLPLICAVGARPVPDPAAAGGRLQLAALRAGAIQASGPTRLGRGYRRRLAVEIHPLRRHRACRISSIGSWNRTRPRFFFFFFWPNGQGAAAEIPASQGSPTKSSWAMMKPASTSGRPAAQGAAGAMAAIQGHCGNRAHVPGREAMAGHPESPNTM